MTQYAVLLSELTADTAKSVNTDFLASDFQTNRADSIVRITVASQDASVLKLIPSTGTGFELNDGSALTADSVHVFDLALDTGRTWNLQSPTAGTTTLSMLRVQELSGVA